MTVAVQLSLFVMDYISPKDRVALYKNGWLQCDCGLAFWIWPTATGFTPSECIGRTGAPDLRRFRRWTCWRGIARMTPTERRLT